ncbi:MAG: type IV pilus assembly protein PilM [Gammaproteobacteria bacterium]|nr:type IV pilus assembly protein PilM [Gammaproteobacteria bacterium]
MILPWQKQRSDESLVGLDIGSDFIKLLSINSSIKPYQIKNFAISPIPAGAIVKGEIKDPAAIGAVLKELFKKNQIESKFVALAIPRSSVIIKNINVDKRLNTTEIESRAWIEANHHFPDLVGKIYLDFTVTPSEQDDSQLGLMLVACRKDQVNPYLEALQEGGLRAKLIDLNSNALDRALAFITETMPDINTIALLNLDVTLSTFLVVHESKQIYAHDHSFDGHRLQTRINDYLQSEGGKVASLNDLAYFEILKSALSAHLRHTLHFFYSSRPNINIQKLILSGDLAMIPCLDAFIQQEIGIALQIAKPFINMTFADRIDVATLEQSSPTLMLSAGLALSEDNSIMSDPLL